MYRITIVEGARALGACRSVAPVRLAVAQTSLDMRRNPPDVLVSTRSRLTSNQANCSRDRDPAERCEESGVEKR